MPQSAMIWILSLGALLSGTSQQYILGVPDQVASSCGISLSGVSLLMTAFGLLNALLGPIVLISLGRRSQRFQLMFGMGIMCTGLVVFASSTNFAVMLVGRGIMGIGNGVYIPTSYSFSQRLAKPGRQGTAMADVALGFSAANVLAMPIARALKDVASWNVAYLVLAAVVLVLLFIAYRYFPEEPPAGAVMGLSERVAPLKNRVVVIALLGTFFEFAGYMCLYTYLTPYLDAALPELGQSASLVLLAIGGMGVLGAKLCGWLCDGIGAPKTIAFGLAVQLVFLLALGLFVHTGAMVPVLLCLWACAGSMFVAAQNVVLARIGGQSAGIVIAVSNSFLQLGNAVGSALSGLAISLVPFAFLPLCAAPIICASLIAELFVFRKLD